MEETTQEEPVVKEKSSTVIYKVLYFILAVIEILLATRFTLLLLGANINAGFSQFIKVLTDPLMAPFAGIFPTRQGESGTFSFSIIVAMIVYALIFWGIVKLIQIIKR